MINSFITLFLALDHAHFPCKFNSNLCGPAEDADALSVRESVALPLNLEMGNTPEMVDFALRLKPDYI